MKGVTDEVDYEEMLNLEVTFRRLRKGNKKQDVN
jgi:hypothetical protein